MSELYIVCGEPGIGKSRVASHIAEATDAQRIATDEVRKELFGPDPDYTRGESQATYDAMFERARGWLIDGIPVVLDATFMLKKGRERAAALAENFANSFTIVRVRCASSIVENRIEGRDGASDADFSVHQSIRDRFEPLEQQHISIHNEGSWSETTKQIHERVLQK